MRHLLLVLTFLSIFGTSIIAQDCCDIDSKLVICYTSFEDHCNPAVCQFTYDAEFMVGIRAKLENTLNFGPLGISNCDVEAKRLGLISTTQEINDLQCDIVFLGAFYTIFDVTETTLPMELTDAVRNWSMECPENLTILTQGESTRWGYEIVDQNENPNTPGMANLPNIFDGPFGTIDSFNQGGTFQANFSVIPATGATVLAEDTLGRATIVLDQMTNDILLADVGIICNTNGEISTGPNIENSNDILACNIFALGCEIAGFTSFAEVDTTICQGDVIQLPDGMMVSDEGIYTSVLLSATNCDSTIVTSVIFSAPPPTFLDYVGCDQDGTSITIGNTVYDQSFPSGSTIIPNFYGCDSTINVNMVFYDNTEFLVEANICPGEVFSYLGINFDASIDTQFILPNAQNCDSVISLIVEEAEQFEIIVPPNINVENNISFIFDNLIPSDYDIVWTPESGLSCTDCPNPILNNLDNIPQYTLEITTPEGCVENFTIEASYTCRPYIPNIVNAESFTGNDKFGVFVPCDLNDYQMSIFDRWGSLVFQTDDQTNYWNGKLKGEEIQPGVYAYLCEYSNDGIPEQTIGQFTLIR